MIFCIFFFNDTATTEIYTLYLHDALPIYFLEADAHDVPPAQGVSLLQEHIFQVLADRKSTRLNSSHSQISYAVFCLKKKTHLPLSTPHRRGRVPPSKP